MPFWTVFAIVLSAVSFTASYVQAKKAQKRAKRLADEMAGVLLNKESNIEAIPVVYGERRVGGVRAYMTTSGDDRHEYLYVALVVAEGRVEAISDLEIDEVPATDSRFQGLVSYHYKLGDDDQTTSSILDDSLITVDDSDPNWEYQGVVVTNQAYVDDFRLRGVAYVAIRLKYDAEVFAGVPDFTVKVKGRRVYDPRKDSTSSHYDSNLGVSNHRATDNTTWDWTDNAALCLRDYLTNERFGKGLDASDLDDTDFMQAADDIESFTVTPYSNGPTDHKLFSLNAVLDTNEQIFTNVEKILLSCRGFLPYTFGKYGLKIDQAGSSVMTLGTDKIIGDINIIGSRKEDRFNQVIVKFPDQNTRFQPNNVAWPSQSSSNPTSVSDGNSGYLTEAQLHAQFLVEDGELLVDEIDLDHCTDIYQARDLARIFLWRSRNAVNVAFQATSEAMELTVGDVVSITHPTPNWTAKKFQVDEMGINYDGTVTLKCVEYDSTIYAYDPAVEQEDLIDIVTGDPGNVQAPTNVTGTNTGSSLLEDGTFHAVLNVSWTASQDATVIEYEVRYKLDSETPYKYLKTTDTTVRIEGMAPGTYNIAVRALDAFGGKSGFTAGSNVATGIDNTIPGDITNTSVTPGIGNLVASWENPDDDDLKQIRVYVATTNTKPTDPTGVATGESYTVTNVVGASDAARKRYFWLEAEDYSGNIGNTTASFNGIANQATGDDIGTGEVDTGNIADDAVDITKIANTLESTNYVQGSAGWKLTTDGTFEAGDGDFRGTIKATVLDVEDANVHGTLTATNISAGIVTAETLAADVFAEFDDRYGGSGGFYRADNDEFFDGSATKLVPLATVTHDSAKSIRFQCNLVYAWGTSQGYGGTNGLKLRVTFEYSTNNTTWAKVPGSGENSNDYYERSATATIYSVTSAFDLAVDIRYEMTGSSLSDNTAYYFRVKIEYVSATNAFTSSSISGNPLYNGVPIKFNVQQTSGLTASAGDADTVDGLQASQFLRSDTSDTFSGNLTVTGNLTVQGSQTQLETQTLTVEDNNIVLNHSTGDSSGSADDSGITIQDAVNSSTDASILWKATGDYFQFSHPINAISSASNTYAAEFRGAPQPFGSSGVVSNGVKITAGSSSNDTVLLIQELDNTAILTINGFGQTTFANSVTIDGESVTSTKIGQWNTAYTYSQVGHLPLAGGALTGAVTSTGNITTTGNVSGEQFRASYGTVTDPAYTFKNDDDTGMYGAGDSIKFAVNGSSRYTIGATAHTMTGNLSLLGALSVGSVPQTVISSSRVLSNVTANANIITAGTIANARMPNYITSNDTRNTNSTPSSLAKGLYVDFKAQSTIGLTAGGTYAGLLHFRSYGSSTDLTGGNPLQIAYGEDSTNDRPEMYMRIGSGATTWGDWQRIFADDYHPNADKWTTARTVTVTLTGDVTGTANASIDGSANKTITINTTNSFTETDTLDSVTDRGATTTNAISTGAISATGSNNVYAGTFTGGSGQSVTSNGVKIKAGANFNDTTLLVEALDGTDLFKIDGSGVGSFSQRISVQSQDVTGTRIQNWQTAYTYSQVGHLPLAGGALTGALTTTGIDINGSSGDSILRINPNNGSSLDAVAQWNGNAPIGSEGFEIWYDNSVGDVHLHTTYNNSNAAIRFHTRTGTSKATSNERFVISGDGDFDFKSGDFSNVGAIATSGDITVGSNSNINLSGDLKMTGTDSYIWVPNTSSGFTGFYSVDNGVVARYENNTNGWGFMGSPEANYAVKVHGALYATTDIRFDSALKLGANTVIASTRRFYASNGTSSKAAYSFDGDSGTGISRTAAGRIDFLSSGVVKAYIRTGTTNPISDTMYVDGQLSVNGQVVWSGGTSANANTAYGWGDHSTQGYLTAEADTLATVTGRGATTTNAISTGAITSSGKLEVNQAGNGTTNLPSSVAEFSGQEPGGVLKALSLVNSVTGALGNGTAIAFHNASNYSPTGTVRVIQAGDTVTDSKMVLQIYRGGLKDAVTIDHDENMYVGGSIASSGRQTITGGATGDILLTMGSSTQTQYVDLQMASNSGVGELFKNGTAFTQWGGASSFNVYNSNGLIAFHPSGTQNVLQIDTTGLNVGANKTIRMNGTTVIDSSSNITAGTISSGSITATGNITTSGSITSTGTFTSTNLAATGTVNAAQFRASLGTQSAPAYTFKNDDDTGFYGGGNTVYGVTGGQKRLTLNASGVSVHNDLIVLTGKLKFGTVDVIDASRNISASAITATTLKETDGGDGFTEIGSSNFGYFSWGVEIANPNAGYRAMRFAGKKKYFVLEADVLGTSNANHTGMFWGNANGTSIYGGSTTGYKTTHQNTSSFHIRDINGNANQETYNPGFSPSDGAWHHQKIAATPDGYVRVWIDGDLKFEETGYIPSAAGYLGFINYQGTLRFANIRCRTINEDESQHFSNKITSSSAPYASGDRFIKIANNTASAAGTLVTADNGNTWLNADGGKSLWLNWYSLNSPASKTYLHVGNGAGGASIFTVDGTNNRVGINDTSPSFSLDVNGSMRITGDALTSTLSVGSQIGSRSNALSVDNNDNSSPIAAKSEKATVFSVLPWSSGETFIASGVYYDDGTWTHASDNTKNCLFMVSGDKAAWYSSSNSSGSWNVADNQILWDSTGVWKNAVDTGSAITSGGAVTAGNGSTSLGYYVGTTQVIQGSTRNLLNIGTASLGKTTIKPSGYIDSPADHAALNIGRASGGETRAIDIWGSWSSGESKSITANYGSSATQMVGQINVAYLPTTNTAGSSIRFGKLYHGGDSSLYVMELHSESTSLGYLNINRDMVQIGQDSQYAGYGVIGFGGRTNGHNRVFGRTNNNDGLYLASATGRDVHIRTNGSSNNAFRFTAAGQLQVGSGDVTFLDSARNVTAGAIAATSVDSSGAVTGSSFTADQGDRTVSISNGTLTMKGSSGGWAFGLKALGNSGTNHGGFGFLGGADAFTYYYIGATYNNSTNFRFYKSGQLNIGTTTILDSSRTLKNVAGLGIGIAIPSKDFHVYTTANEGMFLQGTGAGVWMDVKSNLSELWSMGADNNGWAVYNRTDSAYRLRCESGGDVDIVTGSLNLGGTKTVSSTRRFYAANGTSVKAAYSFSDETNTGWYKPAAGEIKFIGQSVERLHITSSGEVQVTDGQLRVTNDATSVDALIMGSGTQTAYTNVIWSSNSGTAQIWKAGSLYTSYGGTSAMNIYNSNGKISFHPFGTANVVEIDASSLALGAGKTIRMLSTSGTLISHGSYTDAIGYNPSYGTYIGAGSRYVYSGSSSTGNGGSHPYYSNGATISNITHDAGQINNSYAGQHYIDVGNTGNGGLRVSGSATSGPQIGIRSTATGGTQWQLISNGSGNADGAGRLQLWNTTNSHTAATFGQNGATPIKFYSNKFLLAASNIGIGKEARPEGSVSTSSYNFKNGLFWHSDNTNDYGIFRTADGWSSPNYSQLRIQWPTGIILDGGSAHGKSGVDIVNGSDLKMGGATVIDSSTNGVFNNLRADGGNLIMGDEAYSTSASYVGMKTSNMSGSSDYMIISGVTDGNTYLSAKNGAKVFVRGGGNNGSNELEVTDSTFIRATTSNFYCTGNVTAFYSSDKSLKENIRVIDRPIEKIKQIRGVYFDWTDDYIKGQSGDGQLHVRKDDVGIIAQEVKPVLDEVVTTREDGTLAVRYEKMVALCIEAIKEQQDQIDSLKTIIEEMKNGNN